MSSSMDAIYDDYQDYKSLCKRLGIEPLPMRNDDASAKDWYEHSNQLNDMNITVNLTSGK